MNKKGTRRGDKTNDTFEINYTELISAIEDLERDNGIELKDITDRIAKGIESAINNDRDQDSRFGVVSKVRIAVVLDDVRRRFCVFQKRRIITDASFDIQFTITQKGYQELKNRTTEQAKLLAKQVREIFDNDYNEVIESSVAAIMDSVKQVENRPEGEEASLLYNTIEEMLATSLRTLCESAEALANRFADRDYTEEELGDLARKAVKRIVEKIELNEAEFIPLSEAIDAARDPELQDSLMYEELELDGMRMNDKGESVPVYKSRQLPVSSLINSETGEVSEFAIGSNILYPYSIDGITRTQTKIIKESLIQMIREKNNERRDRAYMQMRNTVVYATVIGADDHRNVYVEFTPTVGSLNIQQAKLPVREQLSNERYPVGKRIYVVVLYPEDRGDGKRRTKEIEVSRKSPLLVTGLFEREVPEIQMGSVRIVKVAREPGVRTKIAVESLNPNVEALGTCIGPKSIRIKNISDELNSEKIDIIEYSGDVARFVANALSPARVISVREVLDDKHPGFTKMLVVVKKENYTLAIGTGGINAKLAAKLTERKIDIESEEESMLI